MIARELNLHKRLTWYKCPITDPPVIISPATNTSLENTVGTGITIECRATGDPAPDITWQRNGERLTVGVVMSPPQDFTDQGDIGVVLQLVVGNLTIESTTSENNGVYSCQAGNVAGNVSLDVQLTVLGIALFAMLFWGCYITVQVLLHFKHTAS